VSGAEGRANLRFEEGDASNLHALADGSFDLVVRIFGAMFAPKPFDVAREMVRVTRPGGRIVVGNWIPNDPTLVAQILRISAAYAPPPPEGFVSPMTWGVESHVSERFGAYYGPTMNAFDAAERNGRTADLQRELEALFAAQNTAAASGATSIPATFLLVTVAR
jgi:ubiquinone/menaquinone biosynthesis C-methylase UbiE